MTNSKLHNALSVGTKINNLCSPLSVLFSEVQIAWMALLG